MAQEGFEVARAYVTVDPDTDDFGKKLAAQLERYDYTLKIDVEPDTAGFREKLAADLGKQEPVEVPVQPDAGSFDERLTAVIEQSKLLAKGGVEVPIKFDTNAASLASIAAATSALTRALGAGDGAGGGGGGGLRLGFGIFRGVTLGTTAVHGLISGLVELAAVVIPATVAAGAWAAVWAQGAQNVQRHLAAVYTATEATANIFHTTAGDAVGLGHALQDAQNKANANVYQALGSAVLLVRENFGKLAGTGLQVGHIFDQFSAKVVYDFSAAGGAGGRLHDVLSAMVPDLVGLGQVFGNLGHALLNLASDMPGAANILLSFVGVATKLIEVISGLPKPLILTVFALHEFNTWGSVAVAAMNRMGLASASVSGSFFGLGRGIGILRNLLGVVPLMFTRLGDAIAVAGAKLPIFSAEVTAAGEATAGFGVDAGVAVAGLSGGWILAITGAAVGLGFLIDKFITARSPAQQFADSLQATADKASNLTVLGVLASNISVLGARYRAATKDIQGASQATTQYASRFAALDPQGQATAADQYNAALQKQQAELQGAAHHAEDLARTYHTSLVGALALADQAGVKLNQTLTAKSWAIAQLQIQSLVQGFKSMGQPVGAVGADMTALAIQSGLAGTKVSQLNSAWDEFMQTLTGGTSGLAAFDQSLTGLTTGANRVTTILGRSGSVTLSVKDFAQSLTSFTGKGAQAWQNFNNVVASTAPQLVDWLRTAGAEGAIRGPQFTKAILDMASSLVPFASRSRTAQTELLGLVDQAGLNVKTFPQLKQAIDASGASTKDLAKIVEQTTTNMGNMSKVAQNLGTVVSSLVTQSMASAALNTVHFGKAVSNLDAAIRNYGANSPQAVAAAQKVAGAQKQANGIIAQGTRLIGNQQQALNGAAGAAQKYAGELAILKNWLDQLHNKTIAINVNIAEHGGIVLPGMGAGTRITTGAEGAIVPGYAPGRDTERARVSPGEAIMVPEWVRAVGAQNVMALNRAFSRGRRSKDGSYAGGGIAASAHFGFPNDTFNITVNTATSSVAGTQGADAFRMTKAQQALARATATSMRQYAQQQISTLQSFSDLASITAPTNKAGQTLPVTGHFLATQLHQKLATLNRFFGLIGRLQREHVDRSLIAQVIALGPDQGVQYAEAILRGGRQLITRLNSEEQRIARAETAIGRRGAEVQFRTPISKGFALALKSAEVEAELKRFGRKIAEEIARELKVPLDDVRGLHPHRRRTATAAADVTFNYYGTDRPSHEMRAEIMRDVTLAISRAG